MTRTRWLPLMLLGCLGIACSGGEVGGGTGGDGEERGVYAIGDNCPPAAPRYCFDFVELRDGQRLPRTACTPCVDEAFLRQKLTEAAQGARGIWKQLQEGLENLWEEAKAWATNTLKGGLRAICPQGVVTYYRDFETSFCMAGPAGAAQCGSGRWQATVGLQCLKACELEFFCTSTKVLVNLDCCSNESPAHSSAVPDEPPACADLREVITGWDGCLPLKQQRCCSQQSCVNAPAPAGCLCEYVGDCESYGTPPPPAPPPPSDPASPPVPASCDFKGGTNYRRCGDCGWQFCLANGQWSASCAPKPEIFPCAAGQTCGADAKCASSSLPPPPPPPPPGPGDCPCSSKVGVDNFCHYPPGTAGCAMTQPGGYCDPNGDQSYADADWIRGYNEYKAKCG